MRAADLGRSGTRALRHAGEILPEYVSLVYALVLVWGLGDVLSTYVVYVVAGDASMEANPWIRDLLAVEPLLVLVVKAAVVLYAGIVLLECRSLVERVPGWRLWFVFVIGVGSLAVLTNLFVAIQFLG